MEIKLYDALPAEAVQIRKQVFMEEQGFTDEFDEIDARAKHLVLFDGETPAATCRFFQGNRPNEYVIGRLAVIKTKRGRQLGSLLMKKAEEAAAGMHATRLLLHAQVRAMPFYEQQGYRVLGEEDLDEDCPHIWMCKLVKSC